MYSAAFIFEISNYDEEFNRLNNLIQEAAESLSGYLGKEVWKAVDGNIINATYYWENEESLKEFSVHPKHIEAKKQYSKWYSGYHILISKVMRSYGDSAISHITPNEREAN